MESRSWYGTWWIPGRESERQPGTLTSGDDGQLQLELLGGFDLSEKLSLERGGISIGRADSRVDLILGVCANKRITLLDCLSTHQPGSLGGPATFHRLSARRGLIGTHLDSAEDRVFEKCRVGLENLTTFLQMYPFTIRENDGVDVAIPKPLRAVVSGWVYEAQLSLPGPRYVETRGATVLEMTSRAVLEITAPEPQSVDEFNAVHLSLMDLVTLASGAPSGTISPVLFRTPAANGRHDVNIEVVGGRTHTAEPDLPGRRYSDFHFTCEDKPFDELIEAWMPLRDVTAEACSVLFGMHYSPPGFTDNELLLSAVVADSLQSALDSGATHLPSDEFTNLMQSLTAAVESPQQRGWVRQVLQNRPTFRSKLEKLADRPAGGAVSLFIPDTFAWARALVSARNGLAHAGAGKHGNIFHLNRATQMLLTLVFMSELGLSADVQERAVRADWYLMNRTL